MTRRDEFTEGVKRLLKDRAGNQCSHPDCRAVAPSLDAINGTIGNLVRDFTRGASGIELRVESRTSIAMLSRPGLPIKLGGTHDIE